MKRKTVTLTLIIFVLLTSLVFAKTNNELINKDELLNLTELNAEIESKVQNVLPTKDIGGNWLKEDSLGHLSITQLKEVADMLLDIVKSGTANFKHISDRTQFNIMSYAADMKDKATFEKIMKMGFNPKIRETLPNGRNANIFSQIVLSENKDALDYLYVNLPYDVLENEMYYALQSLIRADYNYQKLSGNWYSMINNKYTKNTATFEDLKNAVLYGKIEGAEELKIAYQSIPKDSRTKELYSALLSLIYYHRDNISK